MRNYTRPHIEPRLAEPLKPLFPLAIKRENPVSPGRARLQADPENAEQIREPRLAEPLKPLFPLKHEFLKSLDRYIQTSTELASFVRIAIKDNLISDKALDIAKQKLEEFDRAKYE